MSNIKYSVIKTENQYKSYCKKLQGLLLSENEDEQEEAELLAVLIKHYDDEHYDFKGADPVQVLKFMMESNDLKAQDLVDILHINKSTVSRILNYQKGISKESVRKLAEHFKVSQELFNRPYQLKEQLETA
jgi:HTH-type transcriptional regulator/antitoxin HigA